MMGPGRRMRLLKARRLLLFEARDAGSIAYAVGYESASQFSREYARMFGMPPARDAARYRVTASANDAPQTPGKQPSIAKAPARALEVIS